MFASVCGSRLYGFDHEDSDRDIRGTHVVPLRTVLGMNEPDQSVERKLDESPGLDFFTHDIKKYCKLLYNHNGNLLEEVMSPLVVVTSPEHEELRDIMSNCYTSRHHKHYMGMGQRDYSVVTKKLSVKYAIHMYRALLCGYHLMRTGELMPHMYRLNEMYPSGYVTELLDRRRRKEDLTLSATDLERCTVDFAKLSEDVSNAAEASDLPMNSHGDSRLNDLIFRLRTKGGF